MTLIILVLIIGMLFLWYKVNELKSLVNTKISWLEEEIRRIKKASSSEEKARSGEEFVKEKSVEPIEKPSVYQSPAPTATPEKETGLTRTPQGQQPISKPAGTKTPPPDRSWVLPDVKPRPVISSEPKRQRSNWADKWKKFRDDVDWEQYTGKKISAWLGGFSLFIAAAFFVKYSIDNNLLPMGLRLSAGALSGIALILVANRFKGKKYTVMRHTLTSCGIGLLYAIVYATNYYGYITRPLGFALLALVSAAAFVLAVYHKGISISVLGVLGANATPIIVSTGGGNVLMLFVYLAVVNIGVFQVVRYLKSQVLLLVCTAATLLTLSLAVAANYYRLPGEIISGVWTANLVLFTIFLLMRNIDPDQSQSTRWAGYILFGSALAMAVVLLSKTGWAPLFVVTVSIFCAIGLAYENKGWYSKVIPFSALSFFVAMIWVLTKFGPKDFSFSFILFLIYGATGGIGPMLLIRKYGFNKRIMMWFQVFPVAVVGISLLGLVREPHISFWFWPTLLILQVVGIGVSLLISAFIQMGILVLLFVSAGIFWILNVPSSLLGYGFFLFLLLSGTILCISLFFMRNLLPRLKTDLGLEKATAYDLFALPAIRNLEQWMTAAPAIGAFVLLGAAFAVRHPFYPHPGMMTLICFLFLSLFISRRLVFQPPGSLSLVAAAIAQAVWVMNPRSGLDIHFAGVIWPSALFAAALIIPFVAFRAFDRWKQIINAWALFEVSQAIFLLYSSALCWDNIFVKWMPLALAILKLPLVKLLLTRLEGKPERNSILAFHGGALLFYVSALPVLVLDHGWIGLALVFESTALLWLNRRIVHPGLRWVATCLAPIGLIILCVNIPLLKGVNSLPVLNSSVLSLAAAIVALGFGVRPAAYPNRELRKMDLPNYFLWLAVGSGFYLLNLIISDLFAGPGQGFRVLPGRSFLHWVCYGLLWSAFGAMLFRGRKIPYLMRAFGLALVFLGASVLILLPVMLSESVAHMRPLFNLGLLAYLPLMAILFYLFSKEKLTETDYSLKNLLLAIFIITGFMMIKLASGTIFQPGFNFELIRSRTAPMAMASAAVWLLYGLGLLLWPKRLDKPFRITGMALFGIGILKTLLFPFTFRTDFGATTPLVNIPTVLFLFMVVCLAYLTLRNWPHPPWPIPEIQPKVFWGVPLALVTFCVLNIEIAGAFAVKGRPFSMMTHGSLTMQLAYSIGWLVFTTGLMIVGIKWSNIKVRWASILMLVVTSVKIFTLDLWKLGQLYRVGAFVGLAVVLILISFLYQRFLSGEKQDET